MVANLSKSTLEVWSKFLLVITIPLLVGFLGFYNLKSEISTLDKVKDNYVTRDQFEPVREKVSKIDEISVNQAKMAVKIDNIESLLLEVRNELRNNR